MHYQLSQGQYVPGGNRDQKRKLMKAQKYPMKSAIQKNLGGPLSDVFFSCLSPSQQDHVGFTPKLQGPGRDLWVSPSDILEGKVVLSPPYTSRLRQALTHRGIMEMGAQVELKFYKKYEVDLEIALKEKEREMKLQVERMMREAVHADRLAQQLINDQILEKASHDLTNTYQEVLKDSVSLLLTEGVRRMEEAVARTKADMEEELCQAVNSRSDYLGRQFQFQLAWRENELSEKHEIKLKQHRQNCTLAMESAQRECVAILKRTVAQLEAEHITDLLMQAGERSEKYHIEKEQLENNFGDWFMKFFDTEVIKRDFTILELEDKIKQVQTKCDRREVQLREVFRHFQEFINFALKEKPGQAEFLLSIEKELKEVKPQSQDDAEVELMARMIIEYIMKIVDDNTIEASALEHQEETPAEFTTANFRNKIQKEKESCRKLKLFGEKNSSTQSEATFRKNRKLSLATMFEKSPSIQPILNSLNQSRYVTDKNL